MSGMLCQWGNPVRCTAEPDVVIDLSEETGGIVDSIMVCQAHAESVDWLMHGIWDAFRRVAHVDVAVVRQEDPS